MVAPSGEARLLVDRFSRALRNLRLSVTDRCNLRCAYCMPEQEYVWLPREQFLRFEELSVLVDAFIGLGVERLRLTGGEPLLRRGLPQLVALLAAKPGLRELALTTNGVLLEEFAEPLFAAGLDRVSVSLDTLTRERFAALTRRDDLDRVRAGIAAAQRAGEAHGRGPLKLDSVIIRGTNDDEIDALLEYAREVGGEVRFIEYMDVGGATRWSMERVVPRREILDRLEARYGRIEALPERSSAPAERFALRDGTIFGIIASTTAPFCSTCDRSRLTADGIWYRCLYARSGTDLRGPLRQGATAEGLSALIADAWRSRADRGAEERLHLAATERARRLVAPIELRGDPHLEMHTRGG
ncbi:MAG TPA: GTP 3',8-cyclase MoaA [Deltaproteobacteria bacterium]|jgi:cyclic pyranopterin phosphate synthase|nr:GTP 3',8-cyclase MoaA [Deltaproteobacteria bacterium]